MGGELAVALFVFGASAIAVIFCGAKLAVYGDALASLTGWGRLFVGSLLVALATSLPELATNITAVRLDPPNPELPRMSRIDPDSPPRVMFPMWSSIPRGALTAIGF